MADVAEKPVEGVKNGGDTAKAEEKAPENPPTDEIKKEEADKAVKEETKVDGDATGVTKETKVDGDATEVTKETKVDGDATVVKEETKVDGVATVVKEETKVGGDATKKPKKETSDGEGEEKSDGNAHLTKKERAIIRQVEYYFSDANLRRDKFLLEQISKDADGWVPITVLLTFKRLSALSEDSTEIIDAIIKSEEGLLEISDDKEKLRRHPERPIPEHNEEQRKEVQSRTAYAKGFPLETTMSELLDFFAPYEKVLHVTMRKYLDKPSKSYKFKGSVFVTFAKKEQAQEFIEKEKVLYNDRELLRKWQEKYLEERKEESKAKSKKGKEKKPQKEENKIELPKGTVVFFENCTDAVTRELLREAVEKVEGEWEIAYIDYSKGEKIGHIRFAEEGNAKGFIEKLEENKLKLKDDIELALRTLTEEEEETYFAKAIEHMKSRRNYHNNNKNKGGHGNRKRHGGHNNRNDHKKAKVDN